MPPFAWGHQRMQFRLDNAHLDWILEGTRYSDKVIALFRQHYVEGIPRVAAGEALSFSQPFASKKFAEFDALIQKKCKEESLLITAILHDKNDFEKFLDLDSIIN